MKWTEQEKIIIEKADFYRLNEIVCHVLTIPKGTFKNGLIVSELQQDKFFWFIEHDSSTPMRLFLSEIHDIKDYVKSKESEVK